MKKISFNLINFYLFISLLPITYSILKIFYGDVYFKNLIFFFVILLVVLFKKVLINSKLIKKRNDIYSLIFLKVSLLLSIILSLYSPTINNLNTSLILISIISMYYVNNEFIYFINNEENIEKIINFIFSPIIILFFSHFVSYIIHIVTFGDKTFILDFLNYYDWFAENVVISLLIFCIISQYKLNYLNIKLSFLVFFSLYLSILYDTWIATIICALIILIQFFDNYKKISISNKLAFYLLIMTFYFFISLLIFIMSKFIYLDNVLNISNFLNYSVKDRVEELHEAIYYMTNVNIFGSGHIDFFDEKTYHSFISVVIYHNGIFGLIFTILFLLSLFRVVSSNSSYIFGSLIALILFLSIFAYSLIPPFFIIFFFIYKDYK